MNNTTLPPKSTYTGFMQFFGNFKEPSPKDANFIIKGLIMNDLDKHAMGDIFYVKDEFTAHRLVKEINKAPDNKVWLEKIDGTKVSMIKTVVHNFIKKF
jgi:hypothetical protein